MTTFDRDYCIVLRRGPYSPNQPGDYFPDTPAAAMTEDQVVKDIASGEIENIVAVFRFNPVEHTCDDISEDVAWKVLATHLDDYAAPQSWIMSFVEDNLGCKAVAVATREYAR